jgi:nucleoside-diphosphate-sugar epimerase
VDLSTFSIVAKAGCLMSSIIGTGDMSSALAGRALAAGNAVEIVGRDPVKAKELAAALGGATVGTAGTAPAGDIVILAVPPCCIWASSPTRSSTPTSSSASAFSAEHTRTTTSRATSRQSLNGMRSTALQLTIDPHKDSHMRVFVTGGTGHSGSYIVPELIAAGHEVTGLAQSGEAAAALSALGAKVRRGSLEDLDGLKEGAADSDGVIHVAHRQDLLPSGGMDAVAAAELPVMLAYGEALAGTGKPLVAAGSIGSAGNLGRPATEEDPALPSGDEHKGTLRVRNVVETAVVDLAERGVRSSIVRLPPIARSTTDRGGFLPGLIALAKEKGFAGYPGDGANLWGAVHIRDAASLFRLALEKGPAGRYWHASEDGGVPFREIAEAIGSRLGMPTVSVPVDVLMLPGYFGMFTNLVTMDLPASNLITRQTLGWEPTQPKLLADLDNGHYFPAG